MQKDEIDALGSTLVGFLVIGNPGRKEQMLDALLGAVVAVTPPNRQIYSHIHRRRYAVIEVRHVRRGLRQFRLHLFALLVELRHVLVIQVAWEFNNNVNGFDEYGINYDVNGNITSLKRNSSTQGTNSHIEIDNLTYGYSTTNPSQLLTVTDVNDANHNNNGFAIYSGGNASGSYGYDANGNINADPYKNAKMTYNVLNRIDHDSLSTTQYINYTYDASGNLIRKQAYASGTTTQVTDYVDGFVFNNASGSEALAYFPMPEGRILNNAGTLTAEYVIADQQGNARISFQDNGSGVAVVKQENSYYGFGMAMLTSPVSLPSTPNKQLYNGGSEWQNDFANLPNYYQTFYRNYDPAIGRFTGVDPEAESVESMSPYQYAGNNPIMYNDPLGNKLKIVDPPPSGVDLNAYAQNVASGGNLGYYGYGGSEYADGSGGGYDPVGAWAAVETSPGYQQYLSDLSDVDGNGNPTAAQIAAVNARDVAAQTAGPTSMAVAAQLNSVASAALQAGGQGVHISASPGGGYKVSYQDDDPTDVEYSEQDDGNGGQVISGATVTGKVIQVGSPIDWGGATNAAFGLAGGLAEMALGAVTTELGVGVFAVADGGVRTALNAGRLLAYLNGEKLRVNNTPSNFGGLIGAVLDGNGNLDNKPGSWQNRLGLANDAVTFILTGTTNWNGPALNAPAAAVGVASDAYTIISTYFQVVH